MHTPSPEEIDRVCDDIAAHGVKLAEQLCRLMTVAVMLRAEAGKRREERR